MAAAETEPETQDLEVGRTETASIAGGGRSVPYEVDADPAEAIVVTVAPDEELDPALEVTTPDGVARVENRFGAGEPEQIVVPPAGDGDPVHQVRVISTASTQGDLELTATSLEVAELSPPDEATGEVDGDAVGGLAVFAIGVGGSEPSDTVEVTVAPALQVGGSGPRSVPQGKALDPVVSAIDPNGNGESVDNSPGGNVEAVELSGEGWHVIVMRGEGSTTGSFTVSAIRVGDMEIGTAATFTELVPGEPVYTSAGPDVEQGFGIEGSPDEWTAISVRPDQLLDPLMVVESGDQGFEVDNFPAGVREYVTLMPGAADINVQVEGFDQVGGDFEIVATRIVPTPMTSPAPWTQGPTTYRVDTPELDEFVVFTVESGPAMDLLVEGFSEDAYLSSIAAPNERAELVLSGALTGSHVVTVIPSVGFSFRPSLSRPDEVPIGPGGTVTRTGPVVLTVDVPPGEQLELSVQPDGDNAVLLDVVDPEGGVTDIPPSSEPSEAVLATVGEYGPGRYEIAITSMVGGGSYTATLGDG